VLRSKEHLRPLRISHVLAQGTTAVNGPHQGGYVETPSGRGWFLHFHSQGGVWPNPLFGAGAMGRRLANHRTAHRRWHDRRARLCLKETYPYSLDEGQSFHQMGQPSRIYFSRWKAARPAIFSFNTDSSAKTLGAIDVDWVHYAPIRRVVDQQR
jgi:hypothetical protein